MNTTMKNIVRWGKSSWLQIQRPGFDSWHYLVSTIEELLERNSSGSGLESREYGSRDPSRWPRVSFYPQKLALTSQTGGGSSVGIVRSQTQATEFSSV
jgi:hypothetical protein